MFSFENLVKVVKSLIKVERAFLLTYFVSSCSFRTIFDPFNRKMAVPAMHLRFRFHNSQNLVISPISRKLLTLGKRQLVFWILQLIARLTVYSKIIFDR